MGKSTRVVRLVSPFMAQWSVLSFRTTSRARRRFYKEAYSEERSVRILGKAAVHGVPTMAHKFGLFEQTFYVRRRGYDGMDESSVGDLERLQQENARLKKPAAEWGLELGEINAIILKNYRRADATHLCPACAR